MLGYDLGGDHPLHPLRWELTWALAGELGVLEHYQVLEPEPADDETLGRIHTPDYIEAVREASEDDRGAVGHGLGTADNPIFPGMHDNAALIAGGSIDAARAIAHGEVDRAVNFCGGLHHAMPDYASGFCVYNDVALAIKALLDAGVTTVAYVDVDAHHGDGVQAAFYDDPTGADGVDPRDRRCRCSPAPAGPPSSGAARPRAPRSTSRCPPARGCRLAAGLSRGGTRPGAGVPAGGAGHPARRRLAPGGSAGRPEPDHRRAADLLPGAAGPGGVRQRTAAGWPWAGAVTRRSGWCPERGRICWRSSPSRDIDPATPTPADWIALAARARPNVEVPIDMTDGTTGLVALRAVGRFIGVAGRPGDPGHPQQVVPAARPGPARSP